MLLEGLVVRVVAKAIEKGTYLHAFLAFVFQQIEKQ